MSPRKVEASLAALTDGTDSNLKDGFMSDSIRFGIHASSRRVSLPAISLAVVGGLALFGSTASAQDGAPFDDLKRLVDVQQQQIREMHDQIARLQQNAPTPPIPPSEINSPRDGSVPAVPADFAPDAAGAKPGVAAACAKKGRRGLRRRQRPQRQSRIPQRPVPLVCHAEQRFHHAHRRLGAVGQRLVGPSRLH